MSQGDPSFDAPIRPVRLGPVACELAYDVDGAVRMRLAEPLSRLHPQTMTEPRKTLRQRLHVRPGGRRVPPPRQGRVARDH